MSNRPLSPHLQVYKPQMTSVLSIMHRASGLVNAIGALFIAWWLWSVITGPDYFDFVNGFLSSAIGTLLLIIWTVCVSYHLCSGLRHLVWDSGRGFEIEQAYFMGKLVLAGTVVLTALVWLL